jgi:hypothetical protein
MITDHLDDLHWAAVGVSVLAALLIGLVWFAPPVLGGLWARQVATYTGVDDAEIAAGASRPETLAKWLIGFIVAAVVLGLAVEATGARSAVDGLVLGVVLAVGVGATLGSWPPVFARMPWAWWAINTAAFTVMLGAMGAILGGWR